MNLFRLFVGEETVEEVALVDECFTVGVGDVASSSNLCKGAGQAVMTGNDSKESEVGISLARSVGLVGLCLAALSSMMEGNG